MGQDTSRYNNDDFNNFNDPTHFVEPGVNRDTLVTNLDKCIDACDTEKQNMMALYSLEKAELQYRIDEIDGYLAEVNADTDCAYACHLEFDERKQDLVDTTGMAMARLKSPQLPGFDSPVVDDLFISNPTRPTRRANLFPSTAPDDRDPTYFADDGFRGAIGGPALPTLFVEDDGDIAAETPPREQRPYVPPRAPGAAGGYQVTDVDVGAHPLAPNYKDTPKRMEEMMADVRGVWSI